MLKPQNDKKPTGHFIRHHTQPASLESYAFEAMAINHWTLG